MKHKKTVIIGGGIAGLSAGIYCLKNGYDVVLYEKNAAVGGECTGWDRRGYHIDNCIHWLTGCNPADDLYKIWREVGAIDDDVALYREPCFYTLESGDQTLHFWSDIEKARREFLAAAPEDEAELNRFFDSVKMAEAVRVPCEKSLADMNFIEYMKFGMRMAEMGKVIREYGNDTVADLADRFRNGCVREMMRSYFNESYKATALISSYAFYTGGTAGIPAGGSVGMVSRIADRFRKLGGKIYTNSCAVKINTYKNRAKSVSFADGSQVECDFVICAADPAVTFGGLLDQRYMDRNLRKMYEAKSGYRVSSTFHVSFGVVGEEDCGIESGSTVCPCKSYTVGTHKFESVAVRMYDYDETLFPRERRVIQCNILQDVADYEYWRALYDDKKRYQAEKQRIAETITARITGLFPELANRLILLDTYSPVTFTEWCGAYKGAYMSFYEQKGYKSLTAKNSVRGLKNVVLASQWLTTNGGLPIAVTSGKFAAACIRAADKGHIMEKKTGLCKGDGNER